MKKKILIAAGGTGGHLFPAQQLAHDLASDNEVLFAGYGLGKNPFFGQERRAFVEIAAAPPTKKGIGQFIKCTIQGCWQAFRLVRRFRPDVVVGFGSYHAFPVLLASWVLRKKIVLFEPNAVLGKVNRLFVPFAALIALQFPLERSWKKQVFVPYLPWRPLQTVSREEARAYFGLSLDLPTILLFGGSQGATFLNERLPLAIDSLPPLTCQVIHLAGKGKSVFYKKQPSCCKEFEANMDLAYRAADIVICRSGAATIGELIQHEIPALLLPFPHAADDHQTKNAHVFVDTVGGGRLLPQKEATQQNLIQEIHVLLNNKKQYKARLQQWNQQRKETFPLHGLVQMLAHKKS